MNDNERFQTVNDLKAYADRIPNKAFLRYGYVCRSYDGFLHCEFSFIEDDALVERLAREGIALEMCPTSELQTSAIDDYAKFPLMSLLERGVCVTVNSDNMGVSVTDVRRELLLLAGIFGLTNDDIHLLLVNAARSAFASDALKEELVRRIDAEF